MDEIKPCPFCGETLIEHEDHHGKWWAHREEPGPCIDSTIQLHDKSDVEQWNYRPIEEEVRNRLAALERENERLRARQQSRVLDGQVGVDDVVQWASWIVSTEGAAGMSGRPERVQRIAHAVMESED